MYKGLLWWLKFRSTTQLVDSNSLPTELHSHDMSFDILAQMQHYKLPYIVNYIEQNVNIANTSFCTHLHCYRLSVVQQTVYITTKIAV